MGSIFFGGGSTIRARAVGLCIFGAAAFLGCALFGEAPVLDNSSVVSRGSGYWIGPEGSLGRWGYPRFGLCLPGMGFDVHGYGGGEGVDVAYIDIGCIFHIFRFP